jgi:peptidoglycan L-alanyl-D-glutamate endopeptidase CwlK
MFSFSERSRLALDTCDPQLVLVAERALELSSIDFVVIEGHRSIDRQKQLFAAGASKLDGVRKMSLHNHSPSRAMDVVPWPIDWQDTRRFYILAGTILTAGRSLGITLRWGGDWDGDGQWKDQTFHDLPHFELQMEL